MAGITGMGDTFDLPNFVGELFNQSTEDTPFLSAIGGLTGGEVVNAKRFEWETYDLRDPSARYRLEGAAAPTAEQRVRANASNVLQIVHEAVDISYTKLAAVGQMGDGTIFPEVQGSNPVTNEWAWQVDKALIQIARDLNYAFINGTYAEPADNATERQTRGLFEAIATNVIAPDLQLDSAWTGEDADDLVDITAHGLVEGQRIQVHTLTGGSGLVEDSDYFVRGGVDLTANTFSIATTRGGAAVSFGSNITVGTLVAYPFVTSNMLGDAMQAAYDSGGLAFGETRVALVSPQQKRSLTEALVTNKGYVEQTRNVGGVNLTVIETDFGQLSIMVDRIVPNGNIALLSLEEFAPVFLPIPGKGFLFLEELAKAGSNQSAQIYGEIGLRYGDELKSAKIVGLG